MATTIRSSFSTDTVDSTRSAFITLSEIISSDTPTVSLAEEETGRTLRGVSSLDSSTSSAAAPGLASPSKVLPSPTNTALPVKADRVVSLFTEREGLSFSGAVEYPPRTAEPSARHILLQLTPELEVDTLPWMEEWVSMIDHFYPDRHAYINDGSDEPEWCPSNQQGVSHIVRKKLLSIDAALSVPMPKLLGTCPRSGSKQTLPRAHLRQPKPATPIVLADLEVVESSIRDQSSRLWFPTKEVPISSTPASSTATAVIDWDAPINWADSDDEDEDETPVVSAPAQIVAPIPSAAEPAVHNTPVINWDAPIDWDDDDEDTEEASVDPVMVPTSAVPEESIPVYSITTSIPAAISLVDSITSPASYTSEEASPINSMASTATIVSEEISASNLATTLTASTAEELNNVDDLSILTVPISEEASPVDTIPSSTSSASEESSSVSESYIPHLAIAAIDSELANTVDETSPLPSPSSDVSNFSDRSDESCTTVGPSDSTPKSDWATRHYRPMIDMGPGPELDEDFFMSPRMRQMVGKFWPEQLLAEDNDERLKLVVLPKEVTDAIDSHVRYQPSKWKTVPYDEEDDYDSVSEYSDVHNEFDEMEFTLPSQPADVISTALSCTPSSKLYEDGESISEYSEAQGALDKLRRDFPYDFESPFLDEDLKEEIIDLSCPLPADVEDAIDSLVYKHHFWNSVSSFGSHASLYSDSDDDDDEEPEFGPAEPLMRHPNVSIGSSFTYEAGITTLKVATCSTLSLTECIFEPEEICSTKTGASQQLPSIASLLDTFSELDSSMPFELLPKSQNLPRLTLEDPDIAALEVVPVTDAKEKKKSKKFTLLKKLARTCSKLTKYD